MLTCLHEQGLLVLSAVAAGLGNSLDSIAVLSFIAPALALLSLACLTKFEVCRASQRTPAFVMHAGASAHAARATHAEFRRRRCCCAQETVEDRAASPVETGGPACARVRRHTPLAKTAPRRRAAAL